MSYFVYYSDRNNNSKIIIYYYTHYTMWLYLFVICNDNVCMLNKRLFWLHIDYTTYCLMVTLLVRLKLVLLFWPPNNKFHRQLLLVISLI